MQQLPPAANEFRIDTARETAAAVAATERAWARMGNDFDTSWRTVGPAIERVGVTAQRRLIARTRQYVPDVLTQTGQRGSQFADFDPTPLLGVVGDGRRMDDAMYWSVIHSKNAVGKGLTSLQARQVGGAWLTMAMGTALADTTRQTMSLELGTRRVGGYTRMVTAGACSRCIVLAGKWFRKNQGFERHPGCHCVHIPASEEVAGDIGVEPIEYFKSLSEEEQNRVFTKAGAEAIRNNADINQVVNARSGMRKSQAGRLQRDAQGLFTTTSGMGRGGHARASMQAHGLPAGSPRLMPESISELARNQDDYLRLLDVYGYM